MTHAGRSSARRAAELSVEEIIRGCMEQLPWPFAITRGATHSLVYANPAFYRLAGVTDGDAIGSPIAESLGALEVGGLSAILDRAFDGRVSLVDQKLEATSADHGDWQCSVWPVVSASGRSEALGIEIRESTPLEFAVELQRRVAEQMLFGALRERGLAEDAEAARRRAAMLAEAGHFFAQTVDLGETLIALAHLALPTLGAWCIVDVLEEEGGISRLGIYHPDPEKQKLAEDLKGTWMPERDDPFGAPAMLRDARTFAITGDIEPTLAASARTPEALHVLRQLGIGSLLIVPLIARKKLIGAITFVGTEHGRAFSPDEVQLAEDLAARGAIALDNARVLNLSATLRKSAESANRAKTAFLSAMSHELRTPLNAIGGYIELLDLGLRGPVTEDQHADFARMKASQRYLTLLITDILNFARVGSGTLSYAVADVNARDAFARAFELVEPLIPQRGLTFDGIRGESGIVARADPEKVTQILVNLFSNAIKFTPAGGHISAECAVVNDAVALRIIDTGIGIPPEKMETIFEPFIQLKEALADRESGVGLGLAISRDLARAMKGDLVVQSTEGKGSTFTVILPLAD